MARLRLVLLALMPALLAGCPKPEAASVDAPPAPAIAASSSRPLRSMQFLRLTLGMAADQAMGTYTFDKLCVLSEPLMPDGQFSGRALLRDSDLPSSFVRGMRSAGLPLVGQGEALFNAVSPDAELLIAITITEFTGKFCFGPAVGPSRGEVTMRVAWNFFDRRTGAVRTVESSGAGASDGLEARGGYRAVGRAFDSAVRMLLADPAFRDIATTPIEPPRPTQRVADARIGALASFRGPIQGRIGDVQLAVVTVLTATGQGSGFVLGREGHVMTAAHVVGAAESVRIQLASGAVVDAAVIGLQSERDVALLKMPPAAVAPLPIAGSVPTIGAEVYAIGSPLGRALQGTVTRGVVSGHPVVDGQRYIQSDAPVLPGNSGGPLVDASGNAVGIVVSVLAHTGGLSRVDLVVPIEDALHAVGLAVEARRPN
jgi:S1-C subfamily serine protease